MLIASDDDGLLFDAEILEGLAYHGDTQSQSRENRRYIFYGRKRCFS